MYEIEELLKNKMQIRLYNINNKRRLAWGIRDEQWLVVPDLKVEPLAFVQRFDTIEEAIRELLKDD